MVAAVGFELKPLGSELKELRYELKPLGSKLKPRRHEHRKEFELEE